MAHGTLEMTLFFKKEMLPKGHMALADRREAQVRQNCQTHGTSQRAATSSEAAAENPYRRLWSDKHKRVSKSPLTGSHRLNRRTECPPRCFMRSFTRAPGCRDAPHEASPEHPAGLSLPSVLIVFRGNNILSSSAAPCGPAVLPRASVASPAWDQ